MTRVELNDFCLLLVNKSLDDCTNFKGISLLHYASNFNGYDYGCHIHYYGKYNVVEFTCDGVDADTVYFEYDRNEYDQALKHFMDIIANYESDLDTIYIRNQISCLYDKEVFDARS
jgi:hypothetical protein